MQQEKETKFSLSELDELDRELDVKESKAHNLRELVLETETVKEVLVYESVSGEEKEELEERLNDLEEELEYELEHF